MVCVYHTYEYINNVLSVYPIEVKTVKYEELLKFYEGLDRSSFLNEAMKDYAHLNEPLPIGFGQTISQPSLVFEMTLLLDFDLNSKVLEIGTGSGYQTALLAKFSDQVFTVERIPELAESAKARLNKMGFTNIHFKLGDGSVGWKEESPYDRIIVTAGAKQLPDELVNQLSVGGKMIIPVGTRYMQHLMVVTKDDQNQIKTEIAGKVIFVELKGKYGWNGS